MGVRKFRSVEEMPGPPVLRPLDPDNLRLAFRLMDLARGLSPIPYVPGVHRYASAGAMRRARSRREAEAARARRRDGESGGGPV